MLESSIVADTNILNIKYSGSLNTQEVEEAQDMLSQMTQDHQEVQLLLEYGEIDLARIQPEAAWKDLHTVGLLSDMQRIAIVADQQIIDTLSAIGSTEVRTFGLDQRDEAFAWLATQAG